MDSKEKKTARERFYSALLLLVLLFPLWLCLYWFSQGTLTYVGIIGFGALQLFLLVIWRVAVDLFIRDGLPPDWPQSPFK